MTTTKTYSWRSCPRRRRICYGRVNGSTPKATKKFFGAAVFQKCCRVIPRSAGDFPLRGKMSVKLTKGSGKNVGVADKGEGHPLKKGNKLFPLTKQTSWSRSMDEEQATAVRLLKKQNGTKYRNFVWSDCKLEYRIGRTADTGRQRSESAGRLGQGFPKKSFMYIS